MSTFNKKLQVSVSLVALMCGGVFAGSSAIALTIDGDETGVVVSDDITGDITVTSTGAISPDGLLVNADITGDLENNGLIEEVVSEAGDNLVSVSIDVIGIDFNGTVGGDVLNAGIINAEADAEAFASVSGSDDFDLYAYASASGADINNVEGDVTNTGTISAVASADAAFVVDGGETPVASVNVSQTAYAYAIGLEVDNPAGTVSNESTGIISATATATSSLNAIVAGESAEILIDDISASAFVTGAYVSGGTYSFNNSGTISATASVVSSVDATVDASESEADISMYHEVSGSAYGVSLRGDTQEFTNSGTISATMSAGAVVDLTATGATSASLSITNDVEGFAYGVYVTTLNGDFDNSGSISATASASLAVTASATDEESYAYISAEDELYAEAIGVYVGEGDNQFTNAQPGTISATASTSATYDLGAVGPGAGISVTSLSLTATATGVRITTGTTDFANAGTISATASSALDLAADASASATSAYVSVESELTALAYGVAISGGIVAQGEDDSLALENSGTISATATVNMTQTIDASGETDAEVDLQNGVYVEAIGVLANGGVNGDVLNSGTISANATATVVIDASAAFGDEAGSATVNSDVEVTAIGVDVNFTTPEDGPLRTFTNTKAISATATVSFNATVPASTDPVPTIVTNVEASAIGASLRGDVGTIVNGGTILATIAAENVTDALAVGLWTPDASEGLEITNGGTISATITGTADNAAAVGLLLGPLVEMSSEMNANALAADVVTVTNTGTISATNATGPAVAISALNLDVPLIINQQGGSISGEFAIAFDQGNADVLNWTGGAIHGTVLADEVDVVNVFDGTGTPANKTITAGEDFLLLGGAALNIGAADKPIIFQLNGAALGVGEVNVKEDATLVMGPVSEILTGTFNMGPASTLKYIFTPTEAGFIGVVGDANIDGTLSAVATPGLYGDSGSHLVLETTGVINGTFDNVNILGDTLLLDFSATLGEQDLTISWERNAFNAVPGLTINSTSVATALEEGYDPLRTPSAGDPELNDILAAMFTLTDPVKYDRVLNSWSGSEHAQVMRAAANLAEPYLMALTEHLNDTRRSGAPDGQVVMLRPKGSSASIAPLSGAGASGGEEPRMSFWGRAFGRWADTRGDIEADGYEEDTYGAVLGADFRVSPNVVVGVIGGYLDDNLDFDDGDEADITRWSIGGYLSATMDQFYIDGSFTYASDDYKVRRTIVYGDTSCLAFNCTSTASSKYSGDGWMAHAEVGYIFDLGNGTSLQPFAGLNFSDVGLDPFSETGGGDLGLDVLDGSGKSLQSRLGARLTGEWGDGGSTKWIPELRAEWRHEFKDDPAWIVASLNGLPDNPFGAIGSEVTGDLAVIGAGLTALFSNTVGVFLDYQAAFGSGYSSHIVQGGVRVKF